MGLELKPSKTRIVHTLRKHGGRAGFDFLGFTIRQHPVGKYHTGKDTRGRPLGFKTLIKPSTAKVVLHYRRLADALEENGASGELLEHLRSPGPHVRGCWALDLVLGLT
jgi:RNA-directed DNA polymerase